MALSTSNLNQYDIEYPDYSMTSVFDTVIATQVAALRSTGDLTTAVDLSLGATGAINFAASGSNLLALNALPDGSAILGATNSMQISLLPGDTAKTTNIGSFVVSESGTTQNIYTNLSELDILNNLKVQGSEIVNNDLMVGGSVLGASLNMMRNFGDKKVGYGFRISDNSNLELYKYDDSANATKRIAILGRGDVSGPSDVPDFPLPGANIAENAGLVFEANWQVNQLSNVYLLSGSNVGIGVTTPSNALEVVGNAQFTSVSVSGNIVPNEDITYDLGTSTNRFRDLFLSGNTISLGSTTISSSASGGSAFSAVEASNIHVSVELNAASATFASTSIPSLGLTANLPFDGALTDSVGLVSFSNVVGTAAYTSTCKIGSSALDLTANTAMASASNYITYKAASNLAGPISMAMWFKPASLSTAGNFQTIAGFGSSNSFAYDFVMSSLGVYSDLFIAGATFATAVAPVVAGNWYHICSTVSPGGAHSVYLNGNLVSSVSGVPATGLITSAKIGKTTTPVSMFRVGAQAGTARQAFKGIIDDIRIYRRALTAFEVGCLYNITNATPSAPGLNISAAGQMAIGKAVPSQALDVVGSITATSVVSASNVSASNMTVANAIAATSMVASDTISASNVVASNVAISSGMSAASLTLTGAAKAASFAATSAAGSVTASNIFGSNAQLNTVTVSGPATLSSSLDLAGAARLSNALDVAQAATFYSTIDVKGATTLESTLALTGAATFASSLGVSGAVGLSNALAVAQAATLYSTIDVKGAATLESSLALSGAANLASALNVSGAAILASSLDLAGAARMSNALDVAQAATLYSTIDVKGAATLESTLALSGAANLASALNVSGAAILASSLDLAGAARLSNSLDVAQAATLYSTVDVKGAATLESTLALSGAANLASALNVSGAAILASSLGVSGAAGFSNAVAIAKAATLYDTLDVKGAATLESTLALSGAANLASALNVSGAAILASSLDLAGAARMSNSLDVAQAATLYSTVDVKGAATFESTLALSGAANLASALNVSGAAILASSLGVSGAAGFSNAVAIAKAATLYDTIDVKGAATLESTLALSGAANLANALNVSGAAILASSLGVSGAAGFSNAVDIAKAATLYDALDVKGAATLESTLALSGAANLASSLNVSGAAILTSSLDLAGAARLSNALDVAQAATLYSTIDVKGAATLESTLALAGAANLASSLNVSGAATLASALDLAGAARLSNSLDVAQAATMYSTLDVKGAATLESSLALSGAANLASALNVSGAAILASSLGVSGAVALSNSLAVAKAATLYDALDVKGAATLESTLAVSGAANLASALNVSGAAILASSLALSGAATLSSSLDLVGAARMSNTLDVAHAATLYSTLTVKDDVLIADAACLDTISTSGTLNIATKNANTVNIATADKVQVVNICTHESASVINLGGVNDTVNIKGTLAYINATNLEISDKAVVVNKGGSAATGASAGILVEEAGANTGYVIVDGTRASWNLLAPASAGIVSITPGAAGFTINQGSHNPVSLAAASNGLTLDNQVVGLGLSSGSTNGALAAADWTAFNNASTKVNGSSVSQTELGYVVGVTSSIQTQFSNASAALVAQSNAEGSARVSLSNAVAAQFTAASNMTLLTASQCNITNVGVLKGLSIAGNILPTSNLAYDLGASNMRFRDLYLSGNTIDLGGAKVSKSANGGLSIGSNVYADTVLGITGSFSSNLSAQSFNATTITASTFSGAISTAAQPNITSLGTLTGLSMNGTLVMTNSSAIDAPSTGTLNIGTVNASNINIGSSTLAQTINIGQGYANSVINIGGSTADTLNINAAVNISGGVTHLKATVVDIADKSLTLNKGGAQYSGYGAGIEIEENNVITGYVQVSGDALRTSWQLQAPGSAGIVSITPGASGFTLNQGSHDAVSLGASSNGLSISNQVVSLGLASASAPGALSASDWTSFNNNASAITSLSNAVASSQSAAIASLSNAVASSQSSALASLSNAEAASLAALSNAEAAVILAQGSAQTSALSSLSNAVASSQSSAIASLSNAVASSQSSAIASLSNAVASSQSSLSNAVASSQSSAIASLSNAVASSQSSAISSLSNAVATSQSSAIASLSNAVASSQSALSNAIATKDAAISLAASNVVLQTAAQPNVTSVGTLSSLAVQNNVNLVAGALQFNGANVVSANSTSNLVFNAPAANGMFTWQSSAAANLMQLDNSGKLTVIGDLNAYGTIASASDRRLKRDIEPIASALDKVAALNGVNFTMIESGKRCTGLIAQDVEAVLPEAVLELDSGFKSIAYANLVGLLVEAIKELKAKLPQ